MGILGAGEIFIILVVIFLIFGPEKLPKILQKIGKIMRDLVEIKEEITKPIYEVKDDFTNAAQDVQNEVKAAIEKVNDIQQDIKSNTIDIINDTTRNITGNKE